MTIFRQPLKGDGIKQNKPERDEVNKYSLNIRLICRQEMSYNENAEFVKTNEEAG
jgi:hypothetical protein